MNMKALIGVLSFFIVAATSCLAIDINELRSYLIEKGQRHYYPDYAEYKRLPEVCNKKACFIIVTVEYTSESLHGMRRLAVFSSSGRYLGCYSGLDELPEGVEGNQLRFKKSEYGDTVTFEEIRPPKSIWVDGMVYKFDSAS
jgi:hypothetical protein